MAGTRAEALGRFASFDGVEIAYAAVPGDPGMRTSGSPAVLLLHGYASTHRGNWVQPGIVDTLVAAGRSVVAMDARGHGESGKPHEAAAYEGDAMVRDAAALLDHLDLASVDVVGYSMGAMVAMRLAAADGRVRSAVLGGVGGDGRPPRSGGALSRAMLAPSSRTIENRTARSFRLFAEITGADKEALAAVDRSDSMRSEVAFGEIVVPTLVLVGAKDTLISPATELVERLPDARLEQVPGDHLSAVRDPGFVAAVVRFLDEVSPVDSPPTVPAAPEA